MFTHPSWADDRASSYERLEFLGDSVLELAIAKALYDRFPEASDGRLTKIRAHVVSRHSCAGVAQGPRPRPLLIEQAQDVPEPELDRIGHSRNVLAALLEAAIAAVYLEHGFEITAERRSSRRSIRESSSPAPAPSTTRPSCRRRSRGRATRSSTR